jgi:hypothetical protein
MGGHAHGAGGSPAFHFQRQRVCDVDVRAHCPVRRDGRSEDFAGAGQASFEPRSRARQRVAGSVKSGSTDR